MRRAIVVLGAIAGLAIGGLSWWRRHPRTGAAWVNRVADPWLMRQGVLDESKGELGLLEHVGRKSGTVRLTPVHPVRTAEGFRIVVPLGVASQWAQNVLAAGHCRLAVDGVIHELDEPLLVVPSRVEGLPRAATRLMDWLGFRYLVLRQFAQAPGTLESTPAPSEAQAETASEPPAREAIAIG
jgi:deazaflavin-dependent oxidoreductase (nitroreductase family)